MAIIQTNKGVGVTVADEDVSFLARFRWSLNNSGYASAKIQGQTLAMHRVVVGADSGDIVDHIDGNRLNNVPSNLRVCSAFQNLSNRGMTQANTAGFKGVTFVAKRNKFQAQIRSGNRYLYLGMFANAKDAARAYDSACEALHGEFAVTNRSLGILSAD